MPRKKGDPTKRKPDRQPKARSRKGLLPDQHRKRSVVYVERVRGPEEPKRYGEDDLMTTDTYITITNRFDKDWSHSIELRGEVFRLPGKVIERIIAQRQAIIKGQQRDRGLEAKGQLNRRLQAELEQAAEGL